MGKSLHEEDKIALEVSVLREAFAWLQNTKKVRALVRGAGCPLRCGCATYLAARRSGRSCVYCAARRPCTEALKASASTVN